MPLKRVGSGGIFPSRLNLGARWR